MPDANEPSKIRFAIRPAVEADRTGILKCLREAFEPYRRQYTTEALKDTVLDSDFLTARMRTMHIVVAEADAQVIGTIAGVEHEPGEGHLRGMAVLPEFKGTGLAAQLLEAIEAWLRTRGCTRVTLNTTEPLLAAMKFYEKHGYSRSGSVSDFFGMPLIGYVKDIS
jgi:GNAT superfamily N-acetyltransferase